MAYLFGPAGLKGLWVDPAENGLARLYIIHKFIGIDHCSALEMGPQFQLKIRRALGQIVLSAVFPARTSERD